MPSESKCEPLTLFRPALDGTLHRIKNERVPIIPTGGELSGLAGMQPPQDVNDNI